MPVRKEFEWQDEPPPAGLFPSLVCLLLSVLTWAAVFGFALRAVSQVNPAYIVYQEGQHAFGQAIILLGIPLGAISLGFGAAALREPVVGSVATVLRIGLWLSGLLVTLGCIIFLCNP